MKGRMDKIALWELCILPNDDSAWAFHFANTECSEMCIAIERLRLTWAERMGALSTKF
jgi:hypothetical protein